MWIYNLIQIKLSTFLVQKIRTHLCYWRLDSFKVVYFIISEAPMIDPSSNQNSIFFFPPQKSCTDQNSNASLVHKQFKAPNKKRKRKKFGHMHTLVEPTNQRWQLILSPSRNYFPGGPCKQSSSRSNNFSSCYPKNPLI